MFEQLQAEIAQPIFWLSFSKIVWINVLLSGDNALVIAMVCRGLAPRQRLLGMIFGAGAAILLRVALTGIAANLLETPWLKIAGGIALFFVAVKLLAPPKDEEGSVKEASGLWAAIGIILMADATMSIDNVIAVAAAADGSMLLLILGLALSIPLIVAGASLVVAALDRLPVLVWAGAALLGWISGELVVTDPALASYTHLLNATAVAAGVAAFTLATGAFWRLTHEETVRASS